MAIGGYCINGYGGYFINGYLVVILLMAIWWLFY
jgi:hypothetical protein